MLNEPQQAAVDHPEGPLLIFAGAGSGKTRVLTHRIARLVERGVDPATILAVTFTNKAAGEMEERLIPLIGRDATDVLWLGTFHATGVRILRALAAFTTRKSDFSIYDEHDQLTVVKQALEELHLDKKQFSAGELRDRIVDAKEKAFTWSDIPPIDKESEGFVRVWERYEKWLEAANAYDFEDLLLVPMRLAEGAGTAGEKLRTRFQHVLVDEFQDTSHTQWRFVKALGQATGNITVVGDDDQCHPPGTMVHTAAHLSPKGLERSGNQTPIEELHVGQELVTWDGARRGAWGTADIASIAERPYDGPLYTLHLSNPNGSWSVPVTPNHHMLVWPGSVFSSAGVEKKRAEDVELGDRMTVLRQRVLGEVVRIDIQRYTGPVYSLDVERDHTYCANSVVVHNCIYEWRSADVKIIRSFPEQFPACKVVKLEENYRSSGHVVKAALDVIRTSKSRTDKSLWTRAPAGHPVEIHALDTDRDEGRLIARSIQDERAEREGALLLGHESPVPTVAILYRTHAIARAIEEPLRNAEIPYVILGGPRFYDRKEIRDVLAYLRLVQNPSSNVDLLRAISVPARGLGAAKLTRLQEISSRDGKSLWLATADLLGSGELRPREVEGLRAFRELIYTAQSAKKTGLAPRAIAEMLIEESGYHEMWLEEAKEKAQLGQHDKAEDAEQRAQNVLELVSAIGSYEADQKDKGQRASLDGYLERVALMTSVDRKTEGAVAMMTIHAAKGLEFDRVFIVGCEDGLLPLRPDQGEMSIDEERRLMYVAITRAKKKLSITWSKTRFFRGKLIATLPSRFLRAIDPAEYGEP